MGEPKPVRQRALQLEYRFDRLLADKLVHVYQLLVPERRQSIGRETPQATNPVSGVNHEQASSDLCARVIGPREGDPGAAAFVSNLRLDRMGLKNRLDVGPAFNRPLIRDLPVRQFTKSRNKPRDVFNCRSGSSHSSRLTQAALGAHDPPPPRESSTDCSMRRTHESRPTKHWTADQKWAYARFRVGWHLKSHRNWQANHRAKRRSVNYEN